MFDQFYISFLNSFKDRFRKASVKLSYWYICLLELSFYGMLVSFFAAFSSQMHINTIDGNKTAILLVLGSLFVCFKNWMRYNGKRRHVLNASIKKKSVKALVLIVLPFVFLMLTFLFYQAI